MICIRAIIKDKEMPSDSELASRYKVSERTIRGIRLKHGLNRHHIKRLKSEHKEEEEKELIKVYTPYAGIWLLIPMILQSYIGRTVRLMEVSLKSIDLWHVILTLIIWFVLGFKRLWHLDDFRSESDLGLGLFTGRKNLL